MDESNQGGPGNGLLALVPESQTEAVRKGAEDRGLESRIVSGPSELFSALSQGGWAGTLLSFSADGVDEAVARRVSEVGSAGMLLLSARGASLEISMAAERVGAVALLREPFDVRELSGALEPGLGEIEAVPLPDPDPGEGEIAPIVGSSPEMAEVFQVVARVADTPATVLITGESGTGKELVARAIHREGGKADGPFVPVNCAAIPEHLLESELFGHEKGAFTGAVARKRGRFERAHGGTLFLDEIGDMSLVLQAKILRALEERVVERVGGEEVIELDVRVLAATNRPIQERLEKGEFREDLYYRLAVVEVFIPPLRERVGDVRELALHFAGTFARRYEKEIRGIEGEALDRLRDHTWPGNVRELRNVMDRAVLLSTGPVIRQRDLRLGEQAPKGSPRGDPRGYGYRPSLSLEEVEAEHIRRVLRSTGGHMGDAAEILGIHRNTLTRKVQGYRIEVPDGD